MIDLPANFAAALSSAALRLGVAEPPEVVVEASALPEVGDYSSALAFRLAKVLRRPPRSIAEELVEQLRRQPLEHAAEFNVSGQGYVNLRVDFASYSPSVVAAALPWRRPLVQLPTQGKVVVEHTATNPNKSAHVGHLRNACIGDTVARILRALGHQVEVQNYIDDTGVQVADVLVGIRELGLEPKLRESFDRFCSRAYVEVCRRYERQPELLELRRRTLHLIEARDSEVAGEAKSLASRIVDAHLRTMARAGVNYDLLTWESDIIERGFLRHALDWLIEEAVIRKPASGPLAGCWVLPQDGEEEADPEHGEAKVLVKSDGVATYTAKDIAYHLWKFGVLGLDFGYLWWAEGGPASSTAEAELGVLPAAQFGHATRVINVIDQRQSAPQRVVREALARLGFREQADNLEHLAYEVVALSPRAAASLGVNTSEGKSMYALSGRRGIEVAADDLLDEAERQVSQKARDRTTAAVLATSAVRYYLLRFGLNSIITFDFEEALRTNGDTGVYLQYAHARACGILARIEPLPVPPQAPELEVQERELVKTIAVFPATVAEAAESLSPSTLTGYALELATRFNDFYEHTERLYRTEDQALRGWRRGLVDAARSTLAECLGLMGMTALPRI